METVYCSFGVIILSIVNLTFTKPIGYDKSFNDDTLQCIDSNEGPEFERNTPNSFSDFYKPRSRFEGLERYPNRAFDYDKKRSLSDELENVDVTSVQKRQVGVVYKDDKPIGILQPFQRSYRFIPVKDDNSYGFDTNQVADISYNTPNVGGVDKREINLGPAQNLEASYPSILTNFKIVNKLDKKRNYDALTDDNVQDLKATIRKLRSSNTHDTEQIEEELKNILDDMGLIDDEEIHAEKREITEDQRDDEDESLVDDEPKTIQEDRRKRDESYNFNNEDLSSKEGVENERRALAPNEKTSEFKSALADDKRETSEEDNESSREKRQQQDMIPSGSNKKNLEIVENLKDSDVLSVNENKSPLVSKSEITAEGVVNEQSEAKNYQNTEDDYDKRVERQIQSKINSLKQEVKREIEALKRKQTDDTQRKKRQIGENLADEETDQLNPAINVDGDLKPLIRKRRTVKTGELNISSCDNVKVNNLKRRKRETNVSGIRNKRTEHSTDIQNNQKNYKVRQDDGDEGGELLGDDFEQNPILKRQIFNAEHYVDVENEDSNLNVPLYPRNKRSRVVPYSDFYDNFQYNHYDDEDERLKRQNIDANEDFPEKIRSDRFGLHRSIRLKPRFRRRITEDQVMANRPQQLSDMSDLDLFGALPKSYEGELSRYKRVK